MVSDLHIINQLENILKSRIILYGCGDWGKRVISVLWQMDMAPEMVCETNRVTDVLFFGMHIYSIKDIRELRDEKDVLILVCSDRYYGEMIQECENLQFQHASVATIYGFFLSIKMHSGEGRLPPYFDEHVLKNKEYSNRRQKSMIMNYACDMMVRAAESENGLLIYQPGKVGSQSIWNSIRQKAVQFHSLAIPYSCKDMDSELADYYIKRLKSKKRLKIITAVREPISRDLAAMFQNSDLELWPLDMTNSNLFWWYGGYYKDRAQEIDYQQVAYRNQGFSGTLSESFKHLTQIICYFHLDEFSWFDYELRDIFGIDVYQYPFDKKRGYVRICEGNVEVLVLKTEQLFQLQDVIAEFIEDENYVLDTTNEGGQKIYRYAYQEFKKSFLIEKEYYDYYYKNDSRLNHFYTKDEIEKFRNHWREHLSK